jgi:hypothetical protein
VMIETRFRCPLLLKANAGVQITKSQQQQKALYVKYLILVFPILFIYNVKRIYRRITVITRYNFFKSTTLMVEVK